MIRTAKTLSTARLLFQGSYRASKDQRFLRFIDLDARYLDTIPLLFRPVEPLILASKDVIIAVQQFTGLPLWAILALTCVTVRLTIFPLIIVQMKRFSRLGPVAPVFVHMKDAWKMSPLSRREKLIMCFKAYRSISLNERFRMSTIFVYNMVYYPMLISVILSVRKVLSDPSYADATFLYLENFKDIDPLYILPTLTIALYYYNFERFITPQNRHTLISRIRTACQVFLIAWYPFLCCWPSGVVLYMFFNAAFSVLQTTLMIQPWFSSLLSQKIMIYSMMLSKVQYDKGTSQAIIGSIKSGESFHGDRAISEQKLVIQTKQMLMKLEQDSAQFNKEDQELQEQVKKPEDQKQQKEQRKQN